MSDDYSPVKHKNARRSLRLKDHDYSQAGAYFITICVVEAQSILGKIRNENVILSECGNIVENTWLNLPEHFNGIELDSHILMPNHFHGIIFFDDTRRGEVLSPQLIRDRDEAQEGGGTPKMGGGTPPLRKNITLGQIVAYFKYQSTKSINNKYKLSPGRIWQRNYYEHIIRDDKDLKRIREYIFENPIKWELDEYYKP